MSEDASTISKCGRCGHSEHFGVCSKCMITVETDDASKYMGCTYFALTGNPNSSYDGDDF